MTPSNQNSNDLGIERRIDISFLQQRLNGARWRGAAAMMFLVIFSGCPADSSPSQAKASSMTSASETASPTNRIDIPEPVRRNLGINFVRVEYRPVSRTIRLPGRFELIPEARREYRTMLGGQVELHVAQYEPVEPGALLFSLDSPAWRSLQERLSEMNASIQRAEARAFTFEPLMAAHRKHEESLQEVVNLWSERVRQFEQTNAGVVSEDDISRTRSQLAISRSELAELFEKDAELEARRMEVRSELAAARERFDLLLMNVCSLLGMDRETLLGPAPASMERHEHAGGDSHADHPLWRELRIVEVRSAARGIVESFDVTNGSWLAEGDRVLTTVRPDQVRFRARGLQSDLSRLRDGLPGSIVPPQGGSSRFAEEMRGVIQLGLTGDPDERTVEILLTPSAPAGWARPGMAGYLEIVTDGAEVPELAIPLSSTIRDGLAAVFFRRDPRNPDQVIRMEADLGIDDGRWVVVRSGVKEGDEVVTDGAYQLMLALTSSPVRGGHFHPDGTFHADDGGKD